MEPTTSPSNKSWIVWVVAIVAIAAVVIFFIAKKPMPAQITPDMDNNGASTGTSAPHETTNPNAPTGTSVNVNVTSGSNQKSFTISGGNYYFSPNAITVVKGDTVTITLNNAGGMHDLKIEGYGVGTKTISNGQTDSFTFVADKAGTFEFYCSIGNHRAMGMKGTLVVK